jgi:cytochrome c-type biogenesis protein CcmE
MKTTHIVLLVVIGIAIGIIVSMTGSASAYVTFREAQEMAANGDDEKIHVVGELKKDADGKIVGMVYRPEVDPNFFQFQMIDTLHNEMTVIYGNPKPADFERSEKVVIVGTANGEVFKAEKILLKCPSKYTEKEIKVEN